MLRSQDEMNEWAEDQHEKMQRARKAAKRAGASDEDVDKLVKSVITPPIYYFDDNEEESQGSNGNWRDDDITPDQKTTILDEIQEYENLNKFHDFIEEYGIKQEDDTGDTLDNFTKGQASDFLNLVYDNGD